MKGIPETLCDEFVPPEAQLHNVLTERRLRPKPTPPKTVTTRAAIEAPHPGVSYNPSFKVRAARHFLNCISFKVWSLTPLTSHAK